jgi:hypothetical protein
MGDEEVMMSVVVYVVEYRGFLCFFLSFVGGLEWVVM